MTAREISYRPFIDRYLPVALHLLGWLMLIGLIYNGNATRTTTSFFLLRYGPKILSQAVFFYLNYLYLVPVLLGGFKWPRFLFGNFAALLMLSIGLVNISGHKWWFGALNIGWFGFLAVLIRFSVDWFRQKRLDKEKENQQLKSELDFLKAQVNPHFFFNSLNNLYALALKQAPETPGTILKISAIMRYMLYETDAAQVPLQKEVEMINNYISLQQLKSRSENFAPLIIEGAIGGVMIEPLLLLPLVENVFKHGAPPFHLKLELSPQNLRFSTCNLINTDIKIAQGGIGLSNLKRRLTLLYPNKHLLELEKKDDIFRATLTLTNTLK